MIPVLQPLPIDWTGKSSGNRTTGELHDLSPQFDLPYRIIVMEKGYFYTEDLFLMDSRGYVLKENQDYQCIAISKDLMDKEAKSACAVILVTNPDVANIIRIDAQMVGGIYCSVNPAILEIAANVIKSAGRKVSWRNIKDKPSDYRPNGHLHALWELFGFTEQTTIIKRMTTAMNKIVAKKFDGLFDEFMLQFGTVYADVATADARLTTHINDTNLPHGETLVQLSLNNVVNAPVATAAEAAYASDTVRGAYTTPLRSKQAVDANFTPRLTNHVNNLNNPHQDTASKLGTLTNLQLRQLAQNYYDRGETVNQTLALGGQSPAQIYNNARAGIPINQIINGLFQWPAYSLQSPPANTMAQPGPSGTLVWRNIPGVIEAYQKKGNTTVYAGNYLDIYNNSFVEVSMVGAMAWLTSTIGVNFPENTIAVFNTERNYPIGTGGGVYNTTTNNVTLGVLLNGRWQVPGIT